MGDRSTDAIWGIGTRIKARLAALGIDTVHDLATADEASLVGEFGPTMGPHFSRLGRGVSSAHVDDTPWVARAHGRETTYQQNLTEPDEIATAIRALADQVVDDIRREDRPCMRVHLKVRFAPFFTTTRIRKLAEPTFDAATIAATALELLQKLDDDRPIRLLGVRAEMVEPEGGY
jgi:DNA polymerase-4